MRIKRGFTLIELLVVVAIIGLLATLGVIAFREAQKKGRDTKRMGDVRLVFEAFMSANNEGKVICLDNAGACGAVVGGSNVKLSGVRICDSCGGGTDQTKTFVNLQSLKDPLYTGATICDGAMASACDYGLKANSLIDDFELYFYTESPAPALNTTGAHKANKNGIFQ
jgi:prepilin-type N-terminal cleavage/methylation domain-containing protein